MALLEPEKDVATLPPNARTRLRVYDFKRPDKFSKDHLRGVQLLFDNFSRQLTSYFSGLLRMPVHADVRSVDQVSYREYAERLSSPCCVTVISWGQLPTNMLANMSLQVVLPMLDRMCGGTGAPGTVERTLTEIETAMSRKLAQSMSDMLTATIREFNIDYQLKVVSLETNSLFIEQAMAPNDIVLAADIGVKFANQAGLLEFCLPYVLLEPVLPALSANRWLSRGGSDPDQAEEDVPGAIGQVEVPISCRLGGALLSLDEVLSLGRGDVLELGVSRAGDATLYLFGKPKFRAKVGIMGNRMAAMIVGLADEGEGDPS